MQTLFLRGLAMFSVLLSLYGWAVYGNPGLVTGLLIGAFLCMGLGSVAVAGNITHGIGGIFMWFIGFVGVMVGMFLFERFVIDGGPIPGKTFGPPNGMYFADKVMTLFGKWVSFNSTPGDYSFMIVFFILGFVFAAVTAKR